MSDAEKLQQTQAALKEVMTWIDNWSPRFVYDDEWAETKEKVNAVLSTE